LGKAARTVPAAPTWRKRRRLSLCSCNGFMMGYSRGRRTWPQDVLLAYHAERCLSSHCPRFSRRREGFFLYPARSRRCNEKNIGPRQAEDGRLGRHRSFFTREDSFMRRHLALTLGLLAGVALWATPVVRGGEKKGDGKPLLKVTDELTEDDAKDTV